MRMKELKIDSQGILRINTLELSMPSVIVISKGKAKIAELPLYSDTTIKTHQGKVTRVKWNEGEEF